MSTAATIFRAAVIQNTGIKHYKVQSIIFQGTGLCQIIQNIHLNMNGLESCDIVSSVYSLECHSGLLGLLPHG